jgi:NAD+ synthase (glutamine-hydrolysing)
MGQSVRVAMVQDNFHVGDINANARLIIELAGRAREQQADLVIFPELALVGYPPEDLLYRSGFIAQVENAVEKIRQSVSAIDIVFGLPVEHQGILYNTAIWLRDGECLAEYHKQSLPNYSVFDEVRYFSPGTDTCVVTLKDFNFGLVICEDAC